MNEQKLVLKNMTLLWTPYAFKGAKRPFSIRKNNQINWQYGRRVTRSAATMQCHSKLHPKIYNIIHSFL